MRFDLPNLVQAHHDLSSLVQPFTTEEIDLVIKMLPIDKAPGLDGINGLFFEEMLEHSQGGFL